MPKARERQGGAALQIAQLATSIEKKLRERAPDVRRAWEHGGSPEGNVSIKDVTIALEKVVAAAFDQSAGFSYPFGNPRSIDELADLLVDCSRKIARKVDAQNFPVALVYVVQSFKLFLLEPTLLSATHFPGYWWEWQSADISQRVNAEATDETLVEGMAKLDAFDAIVKRLELSQPFFFFPRNRKQLRKLLLPAGSDQASTEMRERRALSTVLLEMYNLDGRYKRSDAELRTAVSRAKERVAAEDAQSRKIERALKALLDILGLPKNVTPAFTVHGLPVDLSGLSECAVHFCATGVPGMFSITVTPSPATGLPGLFGVVLGKRKKADPAEGGAVH